MVEAIFSTCWSQNDRSNWNLFWSSVVQYRSYTSSPIASGHHQRLSQHTKQRSLHSSPFQQLYLSLFLSLSFCRWFLLMGNMRLAKRLQNVRMKVATMQLFVSFSNIFFRLLFGFLLDWCLNSHGNQECCIQEIRCAQSLSSGVFWYVIMEKFIFPSISLSLSLSYSLSCCCCFPFFSP